MPTLQRIGVAASCLAAALLATTASADTLDLAALRAYQGCRIARVSLVGNRLTREGVIRRELRLRPNAPLDSLAVVEDVRRLDNLGIFASIDVRVHPSTAAAETLAASGSLAAVPVAAANPSTPSAVDLEYHLREMPAAVPLPALSYTEENGLSAGLGVAAINLDGRAVRLSARALVGGATTGVFDLRWPRLAGSALDLALRASHLTRDDRIREFEERSDEVTPRCTWRAGDRMRLTGSFSYFRMRSDTAGKTLTSDQDDRLVRLGLSAAHDARDSPWNPARGHYSELQVLRTGGALGGDATFTSWDVDLRQWLRAPGGLTVTCGELLSMQSGVVGIDVPSYLTYTIGGANTVRGYDVVTSGREIGGKNQLLTSVELAGPLRTRRRLDLLKWSVKIGLAGAVFADAGTAWSEPGEFNLPRFRFGFGVGLRVLLPAVEMIRMDLGVGAEGLQLHLASSSKFTAQRQRVR